MHLYDLLPLLPAIFSSLVACQTDPARSHPDYVDLDVPWEPIHYESSNNTLPPLCRFQTTSRLLAPRNCEDPCKLFKDTVLPTGWEGLPFKLGAPAKLGWACLKKVPLNDHWNDARNLLVSIFRAVEFQSTLDILKEVGPPTADDEPVDVIEGLYNLWQEVNAGRIQSQYMFERGIAEVIQKCRDPNFVWYGNLHSGTIGWQRHPDTNLVSVSLDGNAPKIYLQSQLGNPKASPVIFIDGSRPETALDIEMESMHEPDGHARWNRLFAKSKDDFTNRWSVPLDYPGERTVIDLLDGTRVDRENIAYPRQRRDWISIQDTSSMWDKFVKRYTPLGEPSGRGQSAVGQRSLDRNGAPDIGRDRAQSEEIQGRHIAAVTAAGESISTAQITPRDNVPQFTLKVESGATRGYFGAENQLAVLRIETFLDENVEATVSKFLDACVDAKVPKIILDLRKNKGGLPEQGDGVFSHFAPGKVPFNGYRFRAHNLVEQMGHYTEAVVDDHPETVWAFKDFVETDGTTPFTSWSQISSDGHTQYSAVHRLVKPFPESQTDPPFDSRSIAILSDGLCGGACSTLVDRLTTDIAKGARRIVVGGEPTEGPMPLCGGSNGGQNYQYANLEYDVWTAYNQDNELELDEFPYSPTILANLASLNFRDRIRANHPLIPRHYIQDPSDCRIWFTADMLLHQEFLWDKVGKIAFGGPNGALDPTGCVSQGDPNGRQLVVQKKLGWEQSDADYAAGQTDEGVAVADDPSAVGTGDGAGSESSDGPPSVSSLGDWQEYQKEIDEDLKMAEADVQPPQDFSFGVWPEAQLKEIPDKFPWEMNVEVPQAPAKPAEEEKPEAGDKPETEEEPDEIDLLAEEEDLYGLRRKRGENAE